MGSTQSTTAAAATTKTNDKIFTNVSEGTAPAADITPSSSKDTVAGAAAYVNTVSSPSGKQEKEQNSASNDKANLHNKNNNSPINSNTTSTKPKRTGIDLVNHKCRKKKAAYDKCVSKWYNERFLTGKSINQEEECGEFFDLYKQCYMKHLKKEFFDKGNKKVKEGSFLAEELDEDTE